MKLKDFIIGLLGLYSFSLFFFFFFGSLMMFILMPLWIVYYIGWGRKHV